MDRRMTLAIRTVDAFPKYLKAYYGDAASVEWTRRDTMSRTWEDDAYTDLNQIEAACIIAELAAAGIYAET
jgi:hypothetical protein